MHNVPVTMKVEGREVIKTPLGTFKTIRVQPTADAGVVKNRGNIWIWYTDDDRHLPVQMRARLFWGTITFRLVGNENKVESSLLASGRQLQMLIIRPTGIPNPNPCSHCIRSARASAAAAHHEIRSKASSLSGTSPARLCACRPPSLRPHPR